MLWSWLHVILVHVPVILAPLGAFVLIMAIKSHSRREFKFAYSLILISTALSGLAYFTGPLAAEFLDPITSISQDALENHALWGRIAFTLMMMAGAGALIPILNYLQEEEPHPLLVYAVLTLTMLSFAMLVWTAHLGGLLRRPELAF